MAIPAKNILGNPNVTEGSFQIAIEQLRESVIGSGKVYDSANTYMIKDTCEYSGVTYYSKIDNNIGNTPSVGANWGDYADLILGVVHKTGNETIAGIKTLSNNLVFASGAKIQGDFSNASRILRTSLQTSTENGVSVIQTIPNGTGTSSYNICFGSSDIDNSTSLAIGASAIGAEINANKVGSATYPPMVFITGGAERLRIDTSGNVLVTGSGGLGYGTGSGGVVTQLTSKSTAVTLNKPCGQITMNNASLAANAGISFFLNNSLIGLDDLILVNVDWDGISDPTKYNTEASCYFTGGVAIIYVKNITAGSLSEALSINYAIIKGATA